MVRPFPPLSALGGGGKGGLPADLSWFHWKQQEMQIEKKEKTAGSFIRTHVLPSISMSFHPWLWVLQISYIQINREDQLVFDGRSSESHRVHLGTSLNRIGKKPNERQLPCGSSDLYSEGSENNASATCEGTSGFEMFRCCTTSLACGSGKVEISYAIITRVSHWLVLESVN